MPPRGPRVAVDAILVERGKLLVVSRGRDPFRGQPALPGGRVELGERAEEAVLREVLEETGLKVRIASLVGVYSDPGRDPRGHTISIAYAVARMGGVPKAGTDAAAVQWVDLSRLPRLAFDHSQIVSDFVARAGTTGKLRVSSTRALSAREASRSRRGARKRRRGGQAPVP